MPSKWLRKGATKLKKCSERRTDSCSTETDGCCSVIPCKYCLEWETYDGIEYGSSTFSDTSWTGTVAGAAFIAYWERQPSTEVFAAEATNSIGMSFARITGGDYTMGSPGGETGRDADETEIPTTVNSFYVQGSEVTQAHYQTVMGTNPSGFSGTGRPVETVSYTNAQAFCEALNALPAEIAAGRTYRLPTEAEWEYACRAETTTAYSFGADPADLTTYGWYTTNSGAETHDVGLKPPNTYGLTDMHGNVWEWCVNSRMDGDAAIRGGGWNSSAADCRSASRDVVATTTTRNDIGFRVIMEVAPTIVLGECEFVVRFGNEEVYRKSCYEGQSCRDSSDSTEASIDYETGTLRWTKYLSRPLPVVTDPDTGCRVHFCGTCHCTTECLCVAISTAVLPGYGSTQYAGEICDTAYSDCEGPRWAGSVGGYDIDLQLDADEYDGSCILHGTIAGEAVEVALAAGCSEIDETFELYAGDTIRVQSKDCFCPTDEPGICMCGRGFGTSPTITFVSNNAPGTVHTVTMSYSSAITDDGITCAPISPCQGYTGRFDGILAIPMGGTRSEGIEFRIVCSIECSGYCLYYRFDSAVSAGNAAWCRRDMFATDCTCPATVIYRAQNSPTGCDPDPWSYQIPEFVFEEDPANCV